MPISNLTTLVHKMVESGTTFDDRAKETLQHIKNVVDKCVTITQMNRCNRKIVIEMIFKQGGLGDLTVETKERNMP